MSAFEGKYYTSNASAYASFAALFKAHSQQRDCFQTVLTVVRETFSRIRCA